MDFFSTVPHKVEAARRVCAGCPVQLRCLAGALARDEQWGVWGGWVFEPRVVRARVLPMHFEDSVRRGGIACWVVRTTNPWGRRQTRGCFASQSAAITAADRWESEGLWRAEIAKRFARTFGGLVADQELQASDSAPVVGPRSRRRRGGRRERVALEGAVDGRLDELVDLLILRLGRGDDRSGDPAPVRLPPAAGYARSA